MGGDGAMGENISPMRAEPGGLTRGSSPISKAKGLSSLFQDTVSCGLSGIGARREDRLRLKLRLIISILWGRKRAARTELFEGPVVDAWRVSLMN